MAMTKQAFYPCQRCEGKGKISAFSNVLGGTCFKCAGTGKQKIRPAKASLWQVFFTDRCTGAKALMYTISARTAKGAAGIVCNTYSGASQEFLAQYALDSAVIVPCDSARVQIGEPIGVLGLVVLRNA